MSYDGLSAFSTSCCTFAFVVDTKVGTVASSQFYGWSAATGLHWHKVIIELEKDEAAVADEMKLRVRGAEKLYFDPGLAIHLCCFQARAR